MKIRYFAWVRERIGRAEEEIAPPDTVRTIEGLVAWLRTQGSEYESAFASKGVVRVAIDRVHVKPDAVIAGAKEIAFFPPMTGG